MEFGEESCEDFHHGVTEATEKNPLCAPCLRGKNLDTPQTCGEHEKKTPCAPCLRGKNLDTPQRHGGHGEKPFVCSVSPW